MNFHYSSIISAVPGTAEFVLLRRPEIPITIIGRKASATYVALVDTGSDNTIFPKSVASHLGIPAKKTRAIASVFGGARVSLFEGRATLRLESESESMEWQTPLCFFEFPSDEEETVILGHAGFLEYFTATFDGKQAILSLSPNDDFPVKEPKSRRKRERRNGTR